MNQKLNLRLPFFYSLVSFFLIPNDNSKRTVISFLKKLTIFSNPILWALGCFFFPPVKINSTPRLMWSSLLFIFLSNDLAFPEEFNGFNWSPQFFIITYYLRKSRCFTKLRVELIPSKVFPQIIHYKATSCQLKDLFNLVAIGTIFFRINCKIHSIKSVLLIYARFKFYYSTLCLCFGPR